jgi:hypothetical protein
MLASNILQIHRDRIRRGREDVYRTVEEDAARSCARHGCPHPHLAMESLSEPVEVWWLNGFDSEADRQRVTEAYLGNGPLMEALQDIRRRREGLLESDIDMFAAHRPELSRGRSRSIVGARFITVTMTFGDDLPEGAVFETADSTRYVFTPSVTHEDALAAASQSKAAIVFAVRQYWGMPAREWIAADPEFWSAHPAASLK